MMISNLLAIGMPGPVEGLVILAIVIVLFGGRGRISSIMGDLGKGITSFRKGLKDESNSADKADEPIDVTPKDKTS